MNQTGCPPGWATDEILFYGNVPMSCDLSIVAWAVIGTLLIIFKFITAMGHTHLWFARNSKFKAQNLNKHVRRVALIPVLSWVLLSIYLCFLILTWFNLASTENGISAMLYGLGWLVYGTMSDIFLLKFIRLGAKILPTKARAFARPYNEGLTKIDLRGRISLALNLVALLGQTIVLCIMGPLFPGRRIIIQISAVFHVVFTGLHGLAMYFQFERVKDAIHQAQGANGSHVEDLARVLTKINEQEAVIVLFNAFSCILYALVVAWVLIPRYYIFTLFMWLECINFLLILVSNYKAKWIADKKQQSPRSQDKLLSRPQDALPQSPATEGAGEQLVSFANPMIDERSSS